ncbi:2-hydroxyisoflavanone dehydratase-like [Cornus florida]|uniref:2-hydroxyisoflavanone dehydratase-like n=1 Tax=Cornus florida TaxID=4283 RepID=UPI0028A19921|nr:2-hydroxyisoflavanone dehydratase-like [Cornus florida]
MDSANLEVAHEFQFFRVYKDGCVEKFFWPTQKIPPSDDFITGVQSKDVIISSEPEISARIFLPRLSDPSQRLPFLFYIHGGGFSFESTFSPLYHPHIRAIAAEANAIAISVEYRLAPEHLIPACYEDCWEALQWVASQANGKGPDPWINKHADLDRVFIGGDSGGGNISNTLLTRVGSIGLLGVRVVRAVMIHPFFGGREDDDEMWLYMCPGNGGLEDPRLRPVARDLARLGCERVLVLLAENDHLREVGGDYYKRLKKSGWKGTVEIVETTREEHLFHLFSPTTEKALALIKNVSSFINQD